MERAGRGKMGAHASLCYGRGKQTGLEGGRDDDGRGGKGGHLAGRREGRWGNEVGSWPLSLTTPNHNIQPRKETCRHVPKKCCPKLEEMS